MKKWPILDQNHGLTSLEKSQFFDFLNFFFFYSLQRYFFALEYHKKTFSWPRFANKQKMANFGQKPWTNPFGKISIFRLFELLLFIASEGVFSLQNIIKHIFLAQIVQKKKDEKKANFRPKPWTNQFGKISIFRLLELLFFYSLQRCFFALEYHLTYFPGLDCLKKR